MILLIDDYDSFSYNLYQLVGALNPDIRVIRNRDLTVPEIEALAGGKGSSLGSGGMATKLKAARIINEAGGDMIIANGDNPEKLYDIVEGRNVGTRFVGRRQV